MPLLAENKEMPDGWSTSHEEERIPVVSVTNFREFFPKRKPQFLAALVPTMGSFSLGTVLAWSSPALPDLAEREDLGPLSLTDKSWIASLAVLGALISGPITGYLINKFGRKSTMLCFAPPFVLGWALIIFAQNLGMMGAGRFVTGFCGGSFTVAVPVYIFETVEDKLRGLLGSAMVLMLVSGILFAFTVAAFVSWFWLSIICSLLPILFFCCMLGLPETPRYLYLEGKTKKAMHALKWLRGAVLIEQIEPELVQLRNSVEASKEAETGVTFAQILKPSILKPTGICLALMFFQQMGGINAVCFYTVDILRAANPLFDANVASIVIGIVQVVFVFASMLLVDRFGRKFFLITSDVIMAISLAVLGTFFYMKKMSASQDEFQQSFMAYVPVISLITFIIAYSAGSGPLPWLVMSEILPPHVKGIASGIVTSFYWLLAFVATKTFDSFIALLDDHGCYWLYAAICVAGAVYTLLFVPETKGKSAEEMEAYFQGFNEQLDRQREAAERAYMDNILPYHDQKPPYDNNFA